MMRYLLLAMFVMLMNVYSHNTNADEMVTDTSDEPQTIIFGVVPQQATRVLEQLWGPLTQYLSDETGLPIRFATAKNIPSFEQELNQNAYDVAYMNPYHYIYYAKNNGYDAIAKQSNKHIKGILVTHKNSGIHSLQDLQDKTLAFPAPAAFAATILTKSGLNQNNISFSSRYVSTHDSVYLNVSKGFFAAGGGVMRTFNNMPSEIKDQLNILWKTPPYTPHAFAAASDLPTEHKIAIQNALANMHLSDEGLQILNNLGMNNLETSSDQQWDDIRALNFSK